MLFKRRQIQQWLEAPKKGVEAVWWILKGESGKV